jgi:hypothetical protein
MKKTQISSSQVLPSYHPFMISFWWSTLTELPPLLVLKSSSRHTVKGSRIQRSRPLDDDGTSDHDGK